MLNLNYNLNSTILDKATYTLQEDQSFRPFQIQYLIVPGGGGAAGGNNAFISSSDLPKVGIAGNGGVIASGSFCVQPFVTYPVVIGKGGAGGIATSESLAWTGSNGENSAFYNIEAFGGEGGKSQVYVTSSTFAGNGALTSASIANGGSGSQWTYNLPGCLPPTVGCHGGELISSSYYAGGGAGIVVSQSFSPAVPITFNYLIVGGGGAGASRSPQAGTEAAGGGGAGAVLSGSYNPFTDNPNWTNYLVNGVLTFPINVGAGGTASLNSSGTNGFSSSLFEFSAQGGFGGLLSGNGGNSGTGSSNSNFTTAYFGATGIFGGGGAGARADGTAGADLGGGNYDAGDGGIGALWSGSYYGGGGASAISVGAGTVYFGSDGLGSTNAGGGGASNFSAKATNGVSGSVVIKYPIAGLGYFVDKIQGGTISYDGGYKIHTFTQSGNFTIQPGLPILEIDYIIVGGGGAGQASISGDANGGGGGAVVSGSFICEPIVKTYPIVVGAGGKAPTYTGGPTAGLNGSGSLAFGIGAQGGFGGGNSGNSGTGSQFANYIGGFTGSNGGAGARENGTATVDLGGGVWAPGSGGDGALTFTGLYYGAGRRAQYKTGDTVYNGSDGLGINNFGSGGDVAFNTTAGDGYSGSVIIRYAGTGSKASGGQITWDNVNNYTYHTFTSSGNFVLNENTSSMFTSGLAGIGSGNALFSPSGSLTLIPFTGGGSAASYYNQNGVSGSDGFVALRYEGAPLAEGGNIIVTDHYTYHLFSSSGDFYVIGQESNPNINPCA